MNESIPMTPPSEWDHSSLHQWGKWHLLVCADWVDFRELTMTAKKLYWWRRLTAAAADVSVADSACSMCVIGHEWAGGGLLISAELCALLQFAYVPIPLHFIPYGAGFNEPSPSHRSLTACCASPHDMVIAQMLTTETHWPVQYRLTSDRLPGVRWLLDPVHRQHNSKGLRDSTQSHVGQFVQVLICGLNSSVPLDCGETREVLCGLITPNKSPMSWVMWVMWLARVFRNTTQHAAPHRSLTSLLTLTLLHTLPCCLRWM